MNATYRFAFASPLASRAAPRVTFRSSDACDRCGTRRATENVADRDLCATCATLCTTHDADAGFVCEAARIPGCDCCASCLAFTAAALGPTAAARYHAAM